MKNWSPWIPYPRSWISAVFLGAILCGLVDGASKLLPFGYYLNHYLPRLDVLFSVLSMLSPILFIAVIHHFLNLLLDCLLPNNELLEVDKVQGINPGLISWWKGLYSWMVIVLATMISIAIFDVIFVSFTSIQYRNTRDSAFAISAIAGIWVIVAAYFYHFEYLVKRIIISTAKNQ